MAVWQCGHLGHLTTPQHDKNEYEIRIFIISSSKDLEGEGVKGIGQPKVYAIRVKFIYLRYFYAS